MRHDPLPDLCALRASVPVTDLLQAARAARERAHAPYSRFRVGAALRGAAGGIHVGANVENAAFPLGQCAEASALGALVLAGETSLVEALVIGSAEEPCAPCGGCRQRLAEFAAPGTPVHMVNADGTASRTSTVGELLPASFRLRAISDSGGVVSSVADLVRGRRGPGAVAPVIGLVLGSGLGTLAQRISGATIVAYDELPGFPKPTTEGHAGQLVVGTLAGVPVACLAGRVHLYEGQPATAVLPLIRALRELGCRALLLTNAAGSLRPEHGPGSLVLIEDHINLTGTSPLIGANDSAIGPRFPDMSRAYDPVLGALIAEAAGRAGVALGSGVYLGVAGPAFETPAEIRAYRALGADLVGMSTVIETIAARHAGLRVVGLSLVTNLAAGMTSRALDHAHTLAEAEGAAGRLAALVEAALPSLADALA